MQLRSNYIKILGLDLIPFSSVCLLPLDDMHAHTDLIPDASPQPQNILTTHQSNRFMADSPPVACRHTA